MPRYKEHMLAGFINFMVVQRLFFKTGQEAFGNAKSLMPFLVASMAGSIFPDIDTRSKAQRIFHFSILFLALVFLLQQNFFNLAILLVIAIVPILCKHRGIMHDPKFLLAFSVVIFLAAHFNYGQRPTSAFLISFHFFSAAIIHVMLDRWYSYSRRGGRKRTI